MTAPIVTGMPDEASTGLAVQLSGMLESHRGDTTPVFEDTKRLALRGLRLIGQTVSHYRITEELGRGGMGVVYKAEDTKLRRIVALKFLSPHLLTDPQGKTRFLREAQAAAALDHPNISTIHEVHEADGHTFMVMAYIEGEDVGTKIEAGEMALDEALNIAVQVARGLAKAHDSGIVHRDVKPGNVIVTREGVAKVLDFGLAKLATQTKLTKTGTTVGTVRYMSPEQATGGEVDHRTDIWSLGVMLYEMLAGRYPFRGDVEPALVYSILNEDPKPVTETRRGIPIGIEDLIEKALNKDPARRFATMGEFLGALETQRDQIALGIKERKFTAIRKLKRRKRLYATIATIPVVAIAAILAETFYTKSVAIDSIAVLPLVNLSGDSGQDYLVDGITMEFINSLGQVSGFERVISRTSVMQYKNTDKPLQEIARELGVKAFLAGTVQQEGDDLRVAVELVHAATGNNLWSDAFVNNMRGIQSLSRDVARLVVNEIHIELTPEEQSRFAAVREVDSEAYIAYRRGRHFQSVMTLDKLRMSIDQFNQAIEIDSNYALAYCGLALSWILLDQLGGIPVGEGIEKARELSLTALKIDSTLAETHANLGHVLVESDFDWKAAEKRYQTAIRLNPNSSYTRVYYSQLLGMLNRRGEALDQVLHASRIDPLDAFVMMNSVWKHQQAGHNEEALEIYRSAVDIHPDNQFLHWSGACAYMGMRRYDEALAILAKCDSLPEAAVHVAYCKARLGRRAEAQASLDGLDEYNSPLQFAAVYMGLDMTDEALECFRRLKYGPYLAWAQLDPAFQDLVVDPRFRTLMREKNLPGY